MGGGYSLQTEVHILVWAFSENKTRKSSCVNTRGIPPAVWRVLILLSYLGWSPPSTGWTWPPPPPAGPDPPWLDQTPPRLDLTPDPPPPVGWTWPPPAAGPDPPPPRAARPGPPTLGWTWSPPLGQTDLWMDRHVSKHYLPSYYVRGR